MENAITELPSRDETAALAAVGGDSALARELIEALVRSLPEELAVLKRCIESRDWPLLNEASHRLRGATCYCGVPALDNHLQELERAAKACDKDRIKAEITNLEKETERLTIAIRA